MTKNYVGIDVCEKKLDIFIHPSKEYVQFNNTQPVSYTHLTLPTTSRV